MFGFRPVTVAETCVARRAGAGVGDGVLDPYALVVPYSNQYLVSEPFGLTDPVSVTLDGQRRPTPSLSRRPALRPRWS